MSLRGISQPSHHRRERGVFEPASTAKMRLFFPSRCQDLFAIQVDRIR
jgi:hypothetical protein